MKMNKFGDNVLSITPSRRSFESRVHVTEQGHLTNRNTQRLRQSNKQNEYAKSGDIFQ